MAAEAPVVNIALCDITFGTVYYYVVAHENKNLESTQMNKMTVKVILMCHIADFLISLYVVYCLYSLLPVIYSEHYTCCSGKELLESQ